MLRVARELNGGVDSTQAPVSGPIQLATLREQVHGHLRREILAGRIRAGSRLVASQIAKQFGVSRTPVNEALHLLEQEGLVERLPTGVAVVTGLAREEVEELYTLRSVLEGLCAYHAALRMDDATLARLDRLMRALDHATDAGDLATIDALGRQFHEIIRRASGLRRTQALLDSIQQLVDRYRAHTIATPGRPLDAFREHVAIVDALRRRAADEARDAMQAHIMSGWSRARETIAKTGDATGDNA